MHKKNQQFEQLQVELIRHQRLGQIRRQRSTVLVKRPLNMDDIIKKALPYLPEAIPSAAFKSKLNAAPGSKIQSQFKQFHSLESMEECFKEQVSQSSKIRSNPIIDNQIKNDYLSAISLAAAYKDKLEEKTEEKKKIQASNEKYSQKLDQMEQRNSLLEAQFTPHQLFSLYYDFKSIDSLPEQSNRGVLMIKSQKTKLKWKKFAVAMIDNFFLIYEFESVCFFYSFTMYM